MENAVQDLLFLAKRFQGILELVPVLETLGKLDNQVKEKQASLDSLSKKLNDLDDDYDSLESQYNFSKENWADEEKQFQKKLDELSDRAEVSAANVLNEARDQAELIKGKAQKDLDELSSLVSDLNAQKKSLLSDISAFSAQRQALVKAIADIKATL